MSGDSEAPPTYYFSGITFNPTFYTASGKTLKSIIAEIILHLKSMQTDCWMSTRVSTATEC